MSSVSAAAPPIIYLGMDVHKDSITVAVLPLGAKTPTQLQRLPNELPKLKRFLERVARQGALRYEHLSYRKLPQIAVVAVARELVGFLWAVMQDVSTPAAVPA